MYPSKVIFEQSKPINNENSGDLIEFCFNEIYSPKHTLEELVAELEAAIQSRMDSEPEKYLSERSLYDLNPQDIQLKIGEITDQNLHAIISTKGRCLRFIANIQYKAVYLMGYIENTFLIANPDAELWNDYVEVIYIPEDSGLKIKKIKFLE